MKLAPKITNSEDALDPAVLLEEIAKLKNKLRLKEQELFLLKAQLFSSRKERFKSDPEGMSVMFNEVEALAAETPQEQQSDDAEAEDSKQLVGGYTRSKGKRKPLPADLPRERIEFDLDDADKFCKIHGQPLVRIGEKVTEKLTVIPMQVKVTELTTFTYKAPCCEGCKDEFIRSEKEPEAIPKSIASSELLAFIATSKFEDALPLYRLEKIFARYGIEINRTSMARWMIQLSQLVVPLLNLLHEELLASASLHCDETVIQVLNEKDRRPEQNSYMWCLARSYENPIIYFAYHESRSKKAATQLLDGYEGVLQTDGLKTYDSLAKLWPLILLAACWAHVRRKFFHAEKEEKKVAKGKAIAATKALSFIKALYKIEASAKGLPPDKVKEYRQQYALPLLDQFEAWLRTEEKRTLPSSLMGKAIAYALDQWPKLKIYCDHGLARIDNNYVEGHIRPFVIGRNNWCFAATPNGAHASAALYTLVETAKANNLSAFDYLRLIFKELPKAKELADYEKLLPYNVSKHYHVMPYKIPEP